MEIQRQKCNVCKVNLTLDNFKKKRDDSLQKGCNECLVKRKNLADKNKCEHGRIRSRCKDCGGASICEHGRQRSSCKDCGGTSICEHDRQRQNCKECGGSQICEHDRRRQNCKECGDAIKITIKTMIKNSKQYDKKLNRYDANNFIDKCFIQGLVEEYPMCYYEDCKVELQYVKYQNDLATIERLDNSIGHIKSNCVICCLKCNRMRKSNKE